MRRTWFLTVIACPDREQHVLDWARDATSDFWTIASARPRTGRGGRAGRHAWSATASWPPAADQFGRGLQALGLGPGDTVAGCCRTASSARALLRRHADRALLVPINWHLAGAEIAYIVGDSDAKALRRRTSGSPTSRRPRPTRPASARRRFAVGEVAGFRAAGRARATAADGRAGRAHRGRADALHVGHDRPPKGVKRPLTGADPDDGAARTAWFFAHASASAVRRQRAHLRLAALPHGGADFVGDLDPARATRSC